MTEKTLSDFFTKNQQENPSNGSNSAHIKGKKLAREMIAEEDRQRNVMIRGYNLQALAAVFTVMHLSQYYSTAGLLRALFFDEKCATCVQFVECAGVR